MGISLFQYMDMEGDASLKAQGPHESFHQANTEATWNLPDPWTPVQEIGPSAEIQAHSDQTFVHGDLDTGEPPQSLGGSQSLSQGLSQTYSHILHCMMEVDLEVSSGLDLEIEPSVASQLAKHVVEKRYSRRDLSPPRSIQTEPEGDMGLCGLSLD